MLIDEPFQFVGHCDPQLDALLDTLPTIANRDEARPLWERYQRLLQMLLPPERAPLVRSHFTTEDMPAIYTAAHVL